MAVKTSATALLKFKETTTSTYVTVGKVRDIKIDINRDAIETTGIGQGDRTYAYGIRGTSGSGTLMYDPADTGNVNIINAILSDSSELSGVQLVFDSSSATGTISGDALITAVGPGVSVGDLVTVPVSFTISGKPTGQF